MIKINKNINKEKTAIFDPPHVPDDSGLRYYQEECVQKIEDVGKGSHLIVLPTGSGKCFAPGTEILMYDGTIRKIETIKEGEQVMGPDSQPRMVVGLAHGREMMYKITPNKGNPYIVNESHILALRSTGNKCYTVDNKGNHYASGDLCNISVKDYLQTSSTFQHCMKGYSSELINFPHKDIIVDPYLLGVWLGDGHSNATIITIADYDTEIIDYIKGYCDKNHLPLAILQNGGRKGNQSKLYSIKNVSRKHFSNPIKEGLKKYNVLNNKHIPHDYKCNDIPTRMALLAGILDTDGFYDQNKHVYEYTSVSERLFDDVLFLARSLGFVAYKHEKKVKGKTYYRCTISGQHLETIPCLVKRKQAIKINRRVNPHNVGISVEPVGEGEYYGFELIGNDRLFLLSDFTVVHNTFCFSHIPRHGRVLILSHRDELVHQPQRYYDCSFGVEQAKEHSNGEEVVSASVQSLVRRLDKFDPYDFDMIITDECHHATAPSYQKIYDYFKPRIHIGFTATPDRHDKNDLHKIFDDILYIKNMSWGIKEGFLTDIDCYQVDVKYNLNDVKSAMGDWVIGALGDAMCQPECICAVADAYRDYHKGQTVIFAANVEHAYMLADQINAIYSKDNHIEAKVLTGSIPSDERAQMLKDFTERKYPCLINVMVLTEGTDMPLIETVIMARPTQNQALYTQAIGRGLRPYPGKEALTFVDCVGISKKKPVNVGHLFGLNIEVVPPKKKKRLQGVRITEMEDVIKDALDGPDSWIDTVRRVKLFTEDMEVDLRDINFTPMGDNTLVLSLSSMKIVVSAPDARGESSVYMKWREEANESTSEKMLLQEAIDYVYTYLLENLADERPLWDDRIVSRWGDAPASDKQIDYITKLASMKGVSLADIKDEQLTKKQATVLIDRMKEMPTVNHSAMKYQNIKMTPNKRKPEYDVFG